MGEQEEGGDIWYPRAKYGHEAFAHDRNWGGGTKVISVGRGRGRRTLRGKEEQL